MEGAPKPQPGGGQPPAAPSAASTNGQRFPELSLKVRGIRNHDVRNGHVYIVTRSELDPRDTEPQFIDETVIDRNRLESLNMQRLNPDVSERTFVKCICSRLLNLREDWYVQMHDGTILCNSCARCFRCRILSFTAARKLNSIDGFVLCNTCMLSYGQYRQPKPRLRLQPLPKTLGDMEMQVEGSAQQSAESPSYQTPSPQGNNANSTASNAAGLGGERGSVNEMLTEARFRDEGRRPLRRIFYPDPRKPDQNRPDYKLEPPPYLAVDRNNGPQACPQCQQQAVSEALVVPGIARVYHERAFQCAACKKPMHAGHQLPFIQFEACSCPLRPQVWCTKLACQRARLLHHTEAKCQLEPLHPGGRPKRDVPGFLPRFDPKQRARDRQSKGQGQQQQQQQQEA